MPLPPLTYRREGDRGFLVTPQAIADLYPLAAAPRTLTVALVGMYADAQNGQPLNLTAELLQAWADQANREPADLEVDWLHRSFQTPELKNDAAAWLAHGSWRLENGALRADVLSYTPDGERDVLNGSFRYLSPGFEWVAFDAKTGELVTRLHHVALVNQPNLVDLPPIGFCRGAIAKGDVLMKKRMLELLKDRGVELPDDATDEQVVEAARAALERAEATIPKELAQDLGVVEQPTVEGARQALSRARAEIPPTLRTALGVAPDADLPACIAASLALRQPRGGGNDEVNRRVLALERRQIDAEIAELIAAGKLTAAEREDYTTLLLNPDETIRGTVRQALSRRVPSGPGAGGLPRDGKKPETPPANPYVEAFARELGVDPAKAAANLSQKE
jgi:hypothetical protein